jgi:hypothetical protein
MTHDPQTHDPKYGNYAEFSSPATPNVKKSYALEWMQVLIHLLEISTEDKAKNRLTIGS